MAGEETLLRETMAEYRHQTLGLRVVHLKLAQMQHCVEDIFDVRPRCPNAPPNKPSLNFEWETPGILRMTAIDEEAQSIDRSCAAIEQLHRPHGGVIGIRNVLAAF